MLRTVVAELHAGCQADAIPYDQEGEHRANELLERESPASGRSANAVPICGRRRQSRPRTGRL
ncbi:hypothetical protein ACS04_28895 [Streptomyces roseus]|uniref:Uncharacterized protein n=1 Tax=Streptomyces roseus TaxID=66430 RepID=A0A0J6XF76_9ACTN|nr:hypothetical protein ACS04_28895 [Streptomyces roseus]